jgi:hypothetical protein
VHYLKAAAVASTLRRLRGRNRFGAAEERTLGARAGSLFGIVNAVLLTSSFALTLHMGAQSCAGNACGSVSVTNLKPRGFVFRNTSNRPIAVQVQFTFGYQCMSATSFPLAPGGQKSWGNPGLCNPFQANFAGPAVGPPPRPPVAAPAGATARDLITFTAGSTFDGINVSFQITNGMTGAQKAQLLGANVSTVTCAQTIAAAALAVGLRATWSGSTVTIWHQPKPYVLTTTGGCTMTMQTIH